MPGCLLHFQPAGRSVAARLRYKKASRHEAPRHRGGELQWSLEKGEAMFQSITLKSGLGAANAEAVVFGYFGAKGKGQPLDARSAAAAKKLGMGDAVEQALGRAEAGGEAGSVVEAFGPARGGKAQRVLLVGLGASEKFEAGGL